MGFRVGVTLGALLGVGVGAPVVGDDDGEYVGDPEGLGVVGDEVGLKDPPGHFSQTTGHNSSTGLAKVPDIEHSCSRLSSGDVEP